jgi:hypothetical protein
MQHSNTGRDDWATSSKPRTKSHGIYLPEIIYLQITEVQVGCRHVHNPLSDLEEPVAHAEGRETLKLGKETLHMPKIGEAP